MPSSGFVVGYVLSYTLPAVLIYLSYCMFPWGEFPNHDKSQDFSKAHENKRDLFGRTGVQKLSSTNDNDVEGYNNIAWNRLLTGWHRAISFFNWTIRFPISFLVLLLVIPLSIGSVLGTSVDVNQTDSDFNLFDDPSEDAKEGQVFVWIGLSYFWVMLASNFCFFIHPLILSRDVDWIYSKLPLQYQSSIYYFAAFLGCFFVFIGSLHLLEEEFAEDILRAAIVQPWLFAFGFYYKGFSAIFDMWGIASLPGMKTIWFAVDKLIVFLVFFYLVKANEIAQIISLVVFLTTNVLPMIIWALHIKKAFVPTEQETTLGTQISRFSAMGNDLQILAIFYNFPMSSVGLEFGAVQYFWNYNELVDLPMRIVTNIPSNEENLFAEVTSYHIAQDLSFFSESLNIEPAPFCQCILPLCILSIPIHYCNESIVGTVKRLERRRAAATGLISPVMARPVSSSKLFRGHESDLGVIIIDSGGLEIAWSVLYQVFSKGRRDYFNIGFLHVFIKVSTIRELVIVAKIWKDMFADPEDEEIQNRSSSFTVLYTGGIHEILLKRATNEGLLLNENLSAQFMANVVRDPRLSLYHLDMAVLFVNGEEKYESAIFTCIGTSSLMGHINSKVRAIKDAEIVFEDFVLETTPYQVPIQKTRANFNRLARDGTQEVVQFHK